MLTCSLNLTLALLNSSPIRMSAPASCVRCVDMNLQRIFPEDSEQCQQCQDSQVHCDGSTSDEEYQPVKDELQKIQERMDAILERTIPNSEAFRKMKHQQNLLESKKRSIRLDKQGSNKHKMEQQILAAERQLLRGLRQIRQGRTRSLYHAQIPRTG